MTLPVVLTSAGAQPADPVTVRNTLLQAVAAVNPGYTANLPGSLIEDISSTDVAAILQMDAAYCDLINSVSPYSANELLLIELGNIYGVQRGTASNTSVNVVFAGSPGVPIAQGFTVGDGTYQYVVQDAGIIGSGGQSLPLYAVSPAAGTWAVPAGSVTQLITQPPPGVVLAVSNPVAGTPSSGQESIDAFRARVLQAGLAVSQGMSTALKTALQAVPGVQARLVSVQQQSGGGWLILVGGGDPYQVANAIFLGLFDISTLVGSIIAVTGITQANPGVVTTDISHGLTTGQTAYVNGAAGMTEINGLALTVTVISDTTFAVGLNTTGFSAWTSGGVVTPNARNISVDIADYPDTYTIPFVTPLQQEVNIALTWNTTEPNFVAPQSVSQLGSPALVSYVNSVAAGQPMNLFELQATFQQAIASIIPPAFLTRMVFTVLIDGVSVSPEAGTGIIAGDPQSYFFTSAANISISQG